MSTHRFLVCAALIAATFAPAATHAVPMQNQPAPTVKERQTAIRYVAGDAGETRAQLMLLAEANPVADFSELFAPALRDTNTYTAILATYEDALNAETDAAKQAFIRYNILQTVLSRAATLPTTVRRTLVSRAESLADMLAKTAKNDPAIWEATGDLYALKGDAKAAAGAYKGIASAGGLAARAWRKTGAAYLSARNYGAARSAFDAGIRADVAASNDGGKQEKHLLYQSLASLALAEGNEKDAIAALLLSAKVKPDANAPYPFRTDVADALLKRGLRKPVREYAEAVLKIAPNDAGAMRLLAVH